jgi:hypothetical protein
MIAALRSEYRKFFSTRMWWVLLLIGFAYVGLTAGALGIVFGSAAAEGDMDILAGIIDIPAYVYGMGPSLGYIFPALVGALSVTGEFRHQTLTPTFLGEPRRWLVLVAKLVGSIPLGALQGLGITAGCVLLGGGGLLATHYPTGLDQADTWLTLGRCVLAMTLWIMVGVGLGTLLKNQVAAIVVLIAFVQFIEPILKMLPTLVGKDLKVFAYLPGTAGEAVAGQSLYAGMIVDADTAGLIYPMLGLGGGVLALLGWAVVLSFLGYFTTWRRDVS